MKEEKSPVRERVRETKGEKKEVEKHLKENMSAMLLHL